MYKLDRTIGLVTVASPIVQNLALLDVDEYLSPDSLTVIHAGFINYIPVINTARRCKYVPIITGRDRGEGCIFTLKWVKMEHLTFLIVLSSVGVHIFDAELTEMVYSYKFKQIKNKNSSVIPIGVVIMKEFICVGVDDGFMYIFKDQKSYEFEFIHKVNFGRCLLIDGTSFNLIAVSRDSITVWEFNSCMFVNQKEISSEPFTSVPSVLKATLEIAIVGFESGELTLYSIDFRKMMVKTQAHKAKITALDYSPLKTMVLTGSLDRTVKVWLFLFPKSSLSCLFTVESNHECCGGAFMNFRCTEFCVVKANNINVDVFTKTDLEED